MAFRAANREHIALLQLSVPVHSPAFAGDPVNKIHTHEVIANK